MSLRETLKPKSVLPLWSQRPPKSINKAKLDVFSFQDWFACSLSLRLSSPAAISQLHSGTDKAFSGIVNEFWHVSEQWIWVGLFQDWFLALGFSCILWKPTWHTLCYRNTMFCASLCAIAGAPKTAQKVHSVLRQSPLPRNNRWSPKPWREMPGYQSFSSPWGWCSLVPLESKFQYQPFPLKMSCLPHCGCSSSWLADLGQAFPFESEKSVSSLQTWDAPGAISYSFEILNDLSEERDFADNSLGICHTLTSLIVS